MTVIGDLQITRKMVQMCDGNQTIQMANKFNDNIELV